ncbi:uncharacterized protein LOC144472622 [Augochlora pura]
MKLCLPVVLVALVATVLHSSESADGEEVCPLNNCMTPDKCDTFIQGSALLCPQAGDKCCSVVKNQFRTHCAHHGGICMNTCAVFLQHSTVDCTDGQVCCTLV